MTWAFPLELEVYEEIGLFDRHIFQSEYQRSKLLEALQPFGLTIDRTRLIPGALDVGEFPFRPRAFEPGGEFVVGRLARNDPDKWNASTWEVYGRIPYSGRKARVMGWDVRIEAKLGSPPAWAEVLSPCREPAAEFWSTLHCALPINGGAGENWPRTGLEAMSSGVPLVVENAWGWKEMIRHGVTGYVASDTAEMAYYAAKLAHEPDVRLAMISAARHTVEHELAEPQHLWNLWADALQ